MSREEIIAMRLEDLSKFLGERIIRLGKIKSDLDEIARLIEEVDIEEKNFSKIFSETKDLNEKLLTYLEGVDAYKDKLLSFENQLRSIESEINEKENSVQNETANATFDKMRLRQYHEQLISFLKDKEDRIKKIKDECKNIFDDNTNKIVDRIKIIERLIAALNRKIKTLEKHGLKEYLDEKQNQVQQIKGELPLKLEDLARREAENLKGLYMYILSEVSSCRNNLIRFSIENNLLEKDEITILETIYGMKQREFDFNEITEVLKKEVSSKSYEEIQTILLSLSRKSFITLKVFLE